MGVPPARWYIHTILAYGDRDTGEALMREETMKNCHCCASCLSAPPQQQQHCPTSFSTPSLTGLAVRNNQQRNIDTDRGIRWSITEPPVSCLLWCFVVYS